MNSTSYPSGRPSPSESGLFGFVEFRNSSKLKDHLGPHHYRRHQRWGPNLLRTNEHLMHYLSRPLSVSQSLGIPSPSRSVPVSEEQTYSAKSTTSALQVTTTLVFLIFKILGLFICCQFMVRLSLETNIPKLMPKEFCTFHDVISWRNVRRQMRCKHPLYAPGL